MEARLEGVVHTAPPLRVTGDTGLGMVGVVAGDASGLGLGLGG